MNGFHRINGINWLTDNAPQRISGTNLKGHIIPGKLPNHWEQVREVILLNNKR